MYRLAETLGFMKKNHGSPQDFLELLEILSIFARNFVIFWQKRFMKYWLGSGESFPETRNSNKIILSFVLDPL